MKRDNSVVTKMSVIRSGHSLESEESQEACPPVGFRMSC